MNRHEDGGTERTAVETANAAVEVAKGQLEKQRGEAANRDWNGFMQRVREHPLLRSRYTKFLGLLLGVPMRIAAAETPTEERLASIAPMSDPYADSVPMIEPEEREEITIDIPAFRSLARIAESIPTPAAEDPLGYRPDRDLLVGLAITARSIEDGQAAPEYVARVGRTEWSPYERSLFAQEPVQERFLQLHPEYRGLSPQEFVATYPEMVETAQSEFRFSNQYRFLTEQAIYLFTAEAPGMSPEKALAQYETLVGSIGRQVGLAEVVRLTDGLAAELPADHPILAYAERVGMGEAKKLVGPSRQNIVHMDQAAGQLRVLRRFGETYVLIDSYPAIGGNLEAPALDLTGKPSGSEFVHVPDTVMAVASVNKAKTSWTWVNSWVPAGAPIRERGDELQYQHPATRQWYDLTGPNAAFFPDRDGVTLKPYDTHVQPMDIALVRAATHRAADGREFVPKAWTKADVIGWNGGELPTEWKLNDFGSVAIRLSVSGKQTNINIHSAPGEEENDFLSGRTHGCFKTYGKYVKDLAKTYGAGSGTKVVVTTEQVYSLSNLLDGK